MKKNILTLLMVCAVTMSFVLVGCGKTGSQSTPAASQATLSGVASLDTAANGTVSVQDSSVPAQEKTAAIKSNGDYTVDVSGLKPPFMLKVEGTDQAGNIQTLHSVSKNGGRTNINPISDTAVAASADTPEGGALSVIRSSEDEHHRTADNFEKIIYRLRTVLAPLYSLYNISGNAVYGDDDDDNDNSGLRAMLRDVQFVVKDGKVTVTNRQTGGVIFSGSLRNLSAGTFYSENMPAGPDGSTACAYTYDAWSVCSSTGTQTRNMLTSSPAGCTGTPVLSQSCTPTTAACTYTYGTWGACLSSGTQLRSLVTSTPAGCSGTPVLTQGCTPACTDYLYSAWSTCTNNTQTRTVASLVPAGCVGTPATASVLTQGGCAQSCTGYNYSAWGACTNNAQTRTVTSLSPAGCVGTPATASVLTQSGCAPACTGYNYSTWGACVNNTQTRTVASLSPAGCVGTPATASVLTQSGCAPTCTTYNYSAWGACVNNTQTRTVASLSPAGCVGTPATASVLTQSGCAPACTTYNYSAWGACTNNTQTRTVASLSPAGCVGTPATASVLTQSGCAPACTTYNYSAWGACTNNTQTRTVASLSPAGCVGTPATASVLTQSGCAPACTTYNYSAWGACVNNTQTRTVASLSPANCVGTPATASVLSQACTPPTPVCGSCHAIPPSSGKHDFHVNSEGIACSTCHGAGYSSTTVNTATHNNTTRDVVSNLNFNTSTRTCGSPGCHGGGRTW